MAGWRKPPAWLPLYDKTSLSETIISDLIDFPARWGAKHLCEFGNLPAIFATVLKRFHPVLCVIHANRQRLACPPIDQHQAPLEALELARPQDNPLANHLNA